MPENGPDESGTMNLILSEWIKAVRSLIQLRIKKLLMSMNTKATSIFKNPEVAGTLSSIHDQYVVVPAESTR